MLSRNSTPLSEGGARRPPHCRTCGEQMKGHKRALCQLRSLSQEPSRPQSVTLGSIFEDTISAAASLPSTPPFTPPHTSRTIKSPRVSFYPNTPINLEPSWEAPPDGTFYHRRNPHIINPLTLSEVARNTPLRRTTSWISTEKAESENGDRVDEDDEDDYFTSTLKSVSSNAPRSRFSPARASTSTTPSLPLTPPTTPPNSKNTTKRHTTRQIDVIDAAGNKVTGLDISTLNENIKSIIRQADLAGYYATIVRPRIGHTSLDICTREDADRHTTVFVSAGTDTMSFNNLVCSEAFQRKAKLASNEGVNTKSWLSVFLAMFFASLIAFWASLILIRALW